MEYYVIINGKQVGPIPENLLLSYGVTQNTKVWRAGLQQWQEAGTLPELAYMFVGNANSNTGGTSPYGNYQPPYTQQPPYVQQPSMPKTWLVESILVALFCCLPFGVIGIIYAANVSQVYNAGDYQGALKKSRNAKRWTLWGFFLGIGLYVLGIIFYIIFFASIFWAASSSYYY